MNAHDYKVMMCKKRKENKEHESHKRKVFLMHKQVYLKQVRDQQQAIQDSLKLEFKKTKFLIVIMRLKLMMKAIYNKIFSRKDEKITDFGGKILASRLLYAYRYDLKIFSNFE